MKRSPKNTQEAVTCPGCGREFSSEQSLGLHFYWRKKNPKLCQPKKTRPGMST